MVTLQIINMLSNEFEIHLIPFDKENKESIKYKINDNVFIEDINFPSSISQFDLNFNKLVENKEYFKAIKLLFKMINTYVFKRKIWRKNLEKMTNENDILVFASQELLLFAPKSRFIVSHFHFNSKLYFSMVQKLFRLLATKPKFTIFLSESTEKAINKQGKMNNTIIYNPCRYEPVLNKEFHNNTLISVCRFEDQKDPMLMLKIAKELDKANFSYTYNIFGSGSYKRKMEKYIKKNNLKNVHLISGETNLKDRYLASDLFIITSKFEGFPLTAIEASSFSLPSIWMEMGDPTSSFIIKNKNGFIIKKRDPKLFKDKIIEVLSNQETLTNLKSTSYESSLRFDKEKIKNKWIETFNILFKKSEEK